MATNANILEAFSESDFNEIQTAINKTKTNNTDLAIGDVVLISDPSGGIGVVRYIDDILCIIGIELTDPIGDTDGTRNHHRYFKCPPKHGIFVNMNDILRLITPQELLLKIVVLNRALAHKHNILKHQEGIDNNKIDSQKLSTNINNEDQLKNEKSKLDKRESELKANHKKLLELHEILSEQKKKLHKKAKKIKKREKRLNALKASISQYVEQQNQYKVFNYAQYSDDDENVSEEEVNHDDLDENKNENDNQKLVDLDKYQVEVQEEAMLIQKEDRTEVDKAMEIMQSLQTETQKTSSEPTNYENIRQKLEKIEVKEKELDCDAAIIATQFLKESDILLTEREEVRKQKEQWQIMMDQIKNQKAKLDKRESELIVNHKKLWKIHEQMSEEKRKLHKKAKKIKAMEKRLNALRRDKGIYHYVEPTEQHHDAIYSGSSDDNVTEEKVEE